MLKLIKNTSLVGVALLGMQVYAAELLIWQVPESKGKIPTFYQEASKSSKIISPFKPHQTVQVVQKEKEWAMINALDHSGQMAWVSADEVESVTMLDVSAYLKLLNIFHAIESFLDVKEPTEKEVGQKLTLERIQKLVGNIQNLEDFLSKLGL